MSEGFADECGNFLLFIEIEGSFLQLAIGDTSEEDSIYISIGLTQVDNLIEYLTKARRLLKDE